MTPQTNVDPHSQAYTMVQAGYDIFLALFGVLALVLVIYALWRLIWNQRK